MKVQQIELDSSLSNVYQKSEAWKQKVKRANVQMQKQIKLNMKKKIKTVPEYIQIESRDLQSYIKKHYEYTNNENINMQNINQGLHFKREYEEQLNRTLKNIL